MDQVDNIGVRAEPVVVLQFLGKFVDGKASGFSSSRVGFGQAFDSHQFTRVDVFSKIDHAEGAMVEKLDGFEASVHANAVSLVE